MGHRHRCLCHLGRVHGHLCFLHLQVDEGWSKGWICEGGWPSRWQPDDSAVDALILPRLFRSTSSRQCAARGGADFFFKGGSVCAWCVESLSSARFAFRFASSVAWSVGSPGAPSDFVGARGEAIFVSVPRRFLIYHFCCHRSYVAIWWLRATFGNKK